MRSRAPGWRHHHHHRSPLPLLLSLLLPPLLLLLLPLLQAWPDRRCRHGHHEARRQHAHRHPRLRRCLLPRLQVPPPEN
jgi:hypothetical protein